MEESCVDEKVSELKRRLESESIQEEEILSIFKSLQTLSIDKRCLAKTLIGNAVSKYKQHSDAQVAKQSKALLRQWRSFVLQSLHQQKGVPAPLTSLESTMTDSASKEDIFKSDSVSQDKIKDLQRNNIQQSTNYPFQGPLCSSLKRNRAREILFQAFMEGISTEKLVGIQESQAAHLVASIEEALWDYYCLEHNNVKGYQAQLRSIKCNLADKKNPDFNLRIYTGLVTPKQLTTLLSTEMASDAKKLERSETKRSALEACQSDWDLRNIKRAEGQFPCGKCKSSKTTYFQLQTRSSDEPMTTFVTCLECGHRWKF